MGRVEVWGEMEVRVSLSFQPGYLADWSWEDGECRWM